MEHSQKSRDEYNAARPTVTALGVTLDMTDRGHCCIFCFALLHGLDVTLRDNDGRLHALSLEDGYKHELRKDSFNPDGWWDVWGTLNGARFAEGQSRNSMGTPLTAKLIKSEET